MFKNFNNRKNKDENKKINNLLISVLSIPKDFIIRHVYIKKYYKNNKVKLNLKKVVFIKNINKNSYKIISNFHYIITNIYRPLIIDELNRIWEHKNNIINSIKNINFKI